MKEPTAYAARSVDLARQLLFAIAADDRSRALAFGYELDRSGVDVQSFLDDLLHYGETGEDRGLLAAAMRRRPPRACSRPRSAAGGRRRRGRRRRR